MSNRYEAVRDIIKPLLHPDYYPIEAHGKVSGRVAKRICKLFGEHILTKDCWCKPHIVSVKAE